MKNTGNRGGVQNRKDRKYVEKTEKKIGKEKKQNGKERKKMAKTEKWYKKKTKQKSCRESQHFANLTRSYPRVFQFELKHSKRVYIKHRAFKNATKQAENFYNESCGNYKKIYNKRYLEL